MVGAISGASVAVVGALVGSAVHEMLHVGAAKAVGGTVRELGWRGGLTGGPLVVWEAPDESAWRARAVGLAPFCAGVVAALVAAIERPTGYLGMATLGFLASLLWGSREDWSLTQSKATARERQP